MKLLSPCSWRLLLPCVLLAGSGCASSEQKQFSSPDAAAQSLVDALRRNDTPRLKQILGPGGDDILSSGDKVADRADAARFLSLYDANHRIQPERDGVNTLIVGNDEWPFPVPIVKSGGGYVFDGESGKEEVLNRRIGRNELAAQQVCLAIADAQREYVRLRPMGGDLPEYAQKLASDPGTKNGLYWPAAEGEPESPLGPLVAAGRAEGYAGSARPYHGYIYRLLTSQGPHAEGGALDYAVDGRLIGGFGIVAYPAQYGNSGIMTFITNHDGVMYQRDFGPDTARIAKGMTSFDPGPGWTKVVSESQSARGD
jgi:hypothetical protein